MSPLSTYFKDSFRFAIAAFALLILIFVGEGLSWKRLWPGFGAPNQMFRLNSLHFDLRQNFLSKVFSFRYLLTLS